MTRCPKTCDKSDPEGKAHGPCERKPGHEGLCVAFGQTWDSGPAPAPPDAPLDFDAARDAALSSPTRSIRDALHSQARAYADAAVKAERERILEKLRTTQSLVPENATASYFGSLDVPLYNLYSWAIREIEEARNDPR